MSETKKKNTIQEEKKVYVQQCTICGKKFSTCNRNRYVCPNCCEYKKSKLQCGSIMADGASYINKCGACGQEFVTVNPSRIRCTSCSCDDLGISPEEVISMFEMGSEPNNSATSGFIVNCHNCSKEVGCKIKNILHMVGCVNGAPVKCSKCTFASKCIKKGTKAASSCKSGVLYRKSRYVTHIDI